jgi:FdhE protein
VTSPASAAQRGELAAELAPAAEALRRLAEVWSRATVSLPDGVPSLEAAAERARNGIPALAEEPLIDGRGLREQVAVVAEALGGIEGFEAAGVAGRHLLAGRLDWDDLALVALAGAWDALEGLAREGDNEPEAIPVLLDYAVRPALRQAASRVQPLLAETTWSRGTCPACGAPPLLSVTSGKESSRYLLCGRCGSSWSWPRTRCATCGEDDHHRLGYLHAPGEGDYRRAEVCDTCHGYLKTIAVLELPDADRLLRLDLETAALDFMALDAGYSRAGGPAS